MDNNESANLTLEILNDLVEVKPKVEGVFINIIAHYITSLPIYNQSLYIAFADLLTNSSDSFKYITRLHIELMKVKLYKEEFYEKYIENHEANKPMLDEATKYIKNWVEVGKVKK